MEQFSLKTKILSGAGSVSQLSQLHIKRLFVVTDPYFMKNGTAQRIASISGAEEIAFFSDVQPDPSVELAAKGTAQLRAFGADTILALGGGSAMDCAKAMAYFSKADHRLIAIPTTSGSGSEVTNFAILTHEKVKHPLVDDSIRPDVAILDSDLLLELPKALIAESGFDVLAHAVESCCATNAGIISDLFAREAFRAAYGALPASYAGQTQVRHKVHLAATMAGVAFTQSGLGLCHALSHALGGILHISHGRLNAIILPAVIQCNAHVAGHKYAELARSAGMGGSAQSIAVRNLRNGLIRLRQELELPQTLAQAGANPRFVWSQVNNIVESTLADPCCATNPVKPDDFLVRRILEEVTGRG